MEKPTEIMKYAKPTNEYLQNQSGRRFESMVDNINQVPIVREIFETVVLELKN